MKPMNESAIGTDDTGCRGIGPGDAKKFSGPGVKLRFSLPKCVIPANETIQILSEHLHRLKFRFEHIILPYVFEDSRIAARRSHVPAPTYRGLER